MKEIEKLTQEETESARKKEFLATFEQKYKEDFLPKTWDDKTKDRVLELTDKSSTKRAIITSIPLLCRSTQCEYRNTCPLFQEGIAPHGEACPIEFGVVRHLMSDFIESLNVDIDNTVEMLLVRDMVDQEVQLLRTSKILAQESFIQENVAGIDSQGDPIMTKQLHLATALQDKLHKRRKTLFDQFIATRDARVKAGVAIMDTATRVSHNMRDFKAALDQQNEELKRKLGYEDHDDYIEAKKAELYPQIED